MVAGKQSTKAMAKIYDGIGNLLAQWAHQQWISLGDRNMKFFQTTTTIRKRHNYIRQVMDENGNWSDNQGFIL